MNGYQDEVALITGNAQGTGNAALFGPFRLSLTERSLYRGDAPVAVGGRAFDILSMLVERAGDVVSKQDILKSAWPDVIVEDTALRVQIAQLRKVIGDGREGARYIASISGRGYCFVAPVRRSKTFQDGHPPSSIGTSSAPAKLPSRRPYMVGRDEVVTALVSLLELHRFVSVVGPGGIGKTTVALAAAHAIAEEFEGAVVFVDLGALTDPSLVVSTIASELGCVIQASDPASALIAFLEDKRLCLVLDSCEHVIDAVAIIAARLFDAAPLVSLLTTTREALRVVGENVYPLQPLELPPLGTNSSAEQVLVSPAVQLFMHRAAANGYGLELTDADAPILAEICHKLDGIALAIEIAASRMHAHGLRGIANLLACRSSLLWQGQRNASPRHQTLHSMLDWSYNLLSRVEQQTLCNLAVFVGWFTLEGARMVAEEDGETLLTLQAIASLVDKSLISTQIADETTYYRLLDTTRAYVLAKRDGGANDPAKRRHATHYRDYLAQLKADRDTESGISLYIGNVHAALEWSFSICGDAGIGVELAACAAPLFLRISLLGECQRWCERGLAALTDSYVGSPHEVALLKSLAISSMFTRGNTPEVRSAIERGLEVAQILEDVEYQLHFLSGLNLFLTRRGDFVGALRVAERNAIVAAQSGPAAVVRAEWMQGATQHMLGNQLAAKHHCELGFKFAATTDRANVNFFGYDHHVRARVALARNQWLRGLPDQAVKTAYQAIDEGARCHHPATLCISLLYATYVFFWCGDFEGAKQLLERALALTQRHSLPAYHAVGYAMKGELLVLSGAHVEGLELLQTAVPALLADDHHVVAAAALRAQAEGLAHCGRPREGRAIIERAVARAEQLGGTFDLPDLMRAHGHILLAPSDSDTISAEKLLVRSMDLARKQAALGWELRSATALARLWAEHGCARRAGKMLTGIYRQFTEGFETLDLAAARQTLRDLDCPVE